MKKGVSGGRRGWDSNAIPRGLRPTAPTGHCRVYELGRWGAKGGGLGGTDAGKEEDGASSWLAVAHSHL